MHVALAGLVAVALVTGPCADVGTPPPDAGSDADADAGDAGDLCGQLAARYVATAADLGYCGTAADCWAYAADCAIETHAGAPTCFLILNQQADRTQFADMSLAWQRLGCPPDAACGTCGAAPALDCQGGACVAVP